MEHSSHRVDPQQVVWEGWGMRDLSSTVNSARLEDHCLLHFITFGDPIIKARISGQLEKLNLHRIQELPFLRNPGSSKILLSPCSVTLWVGTSSSFCSPLAPGTILER